MYEVLSHTEGLTPGTHWISAELLPPDHIRVVEMWVSTETQGPEVWGRPSGKSWYGKSAAKNALIEADSLARVRGIPLYFPDFKYEMG